MSTTEINKNLGNYATETKFEFHKLDVPFLETEEIVPIGLDVGYSSTKVYSIYGSHVFPSLPIKTPNDFTMNSEETDIMYKDEEGNIWFVGDIAQARLERRKIQTQVNTLYDAQRINSPEYLVLLRVGLFFGLIKEDLDDKFKLSNGNIKVKTGLPEQYMSMDREVLKDKFIGHHHFQVKVGNKAWQKVSLDLSDDDVSVMSQPFGTLWSLATNRQGDVVNKDLLKYNVLIFDGGEHTTDTYFSISGQSGTNNTWENLSMMEVIRNTRKDVGKATGNRADSQIHYLKKLLTSSTPGKISYGDRQVYDFTEDFFNNIEKVAYEAIEQINIAYDNLNEVDVLVLTGGTGKAFYPYFSKYYNSDSLQVLMAEREGSKDPTEDFSAVFANAVGFFNCLMGQLKPQLISEKSL